MERRMFLAVVLSFVVLYVYQALVLPPPPAGPVAADPAPPAVERESAWPDVPLPPPAADRPAPGIAPVVVPEPDPVVGDGQPRDIVVESPAFRAVFSNRGAVLVSWTLKDYLDAGRPVELVPRDLPPDVPWPFSLDFEDAGATALAGNALYQPSVAQLTLDDGRSRTLAFEYQDRTGLSVRKVFAFEPAASPYLFRLTVEASLDGEPLDASVRWGPALGGVERTTSGFAYRQGPRGLVMGRVREGGRFSDMEVFRPDGGDVAELPVYAGQLQFAGVDNHYFLAVALPRDADTTVRYRAVPLPAAAPGGEPRELVAFDLSTAGGFSGLEFFVGPKDFDILERAYPPLVRAIEFGWFSALVVPLHRSLTWAHDWVGNYGLAIIVITVLINLIIFPLRYKSIVSMRKMQELQPEMKAIQERYAHLKATDPEKQKMNQEVMALYRDRGVNPVSGCLPMLLTMPILFAFFKLLTMAIELRGAPFVGWISDLSVHDPLYITPLVMGGSMVVQHRMTPSQADPMQQRIMMAMPIVFTFMFLWAPSGLVLYWLTSNLITIAQTVLTNRIMGPPRMRTVRPAAERRVRGARGAKGAGRSAGK